MNCRLPFDWKNPIGYSFAVIIQYLLTARVLTFGAGAMALGYGTFLVLLSLAKDTEGDLNLINKSPKAKRDQTLILERLSEFIQNHSHAKQLSDDVVTHY